MVIRLFCAAGMSTSLLVKKMEEAAKENGVECIIIKRPTDESGMTVSEVEKMILEWL